MNNIDFFYNNYSLFNNIININDASPVLFFIYGTLK